MNKRKTGHRKGTAGPRMRKVAEGKACLKDGKGPETQGKQARGYKEQPTMIILTVRPRGNGG